MLVRNFTDLPSKKRSSVFGSMFANSQKLFCVTEREASVSLNRTPSLCSDVSNLSARLHECVGRSMSRRSSAGVAPKAPRRQ